MQFEMSGLDGLGGMPLHPDDTIDVPEEAMDHPLVIWTTDDGGYRDVAMYINRDGNVNIVDQERLTAWAQATYQNMVTMNRIPVSNEEQP